MTNVTFNVRNENTVDLALELEDATDKAGHGRYNYFLLLTCCIIQLGAGVDMLGFSLVVPAAKCDLNLGLKESGLLNSVPFAGFLFALPWGYFADTCGRRKALLLSSSVGFIFAVINSFSTNFHVMLLLKFLGCSFSTGSFTLTLIYLGECTDIKNRSKYIFIQNCFNLGADFYFFALGFLILPLNFSITMPWISVFRPWRLMGLMMALPLGIGALMVVFLHESPKFLANQGDTKKALDVLSEIFKINGGQKENYPVKFLTNTNQTPPRTFWESIVKQIIPVFRPPLLWRTLQLFYLFSICFSTNNVFFMWFPTLVNSFYNKMPEVTSNSFCDKINFNTSTSDSIDLVECKDSILNSTIYSGLILGAFLVVLNMVISRVAKWRRTAIMVIFLTSSISAVLLDLIIQPEVSMTLFMLLQSTGSVIGNIGGLATGFSIMMARFVCLGGVNVVGIAMLQYCTATFYFWSVYLLSGVGMTFLLPSDRK